MSKKRLHYVLSTHWDREWYQTFQDYRYRLVQLLDRVLDGIAGGELVGPFTTDGQAIVLEDYLEVRPERRAQVEGYARSGRLAIGPWYVMPDEFLVSGESLVGNLRHGRDVARSFGATPSSAGFVCDIFGHISQLPQIFAGFVIRGAFIWRGNNQTERRLLLWKGADGTTIPAYRFGRRGYCTYAFAVRHAMSPERAFDAEDADQDLGQYITEEVSATDTDAVLLFDGGDHQEWDRQVYEVLKGRIDQPYDGVEIMHSTLDAFLEDMMAQRGRIVGRAQGELRDPGREVGAVDSQWLIPGVLSSRVGIRQANAECQTLLCHWAEPMTTLAALAIAMPCPDGYLNVAWRWLLQNQAHDSICGCGIDAVHQDMVYRFAQSRQIADRLTLEATRQVAASVEGDVDLHALRVVVFNPLPQPLNEVMEITLAIPSEWATFNEFFGFEPQPAFRIYGSDGREIVYQRLAQDARRGKTRLRDVRFPERYVTTDVTVALPLSVPPLGYATLVVREETAGTPTRHPSVPGLATSERSLSNVILDVTAQSDGTLMIVRGRNGQRYERLLTLEDCADIGDGWYHGQAVNDQVFASTAAGTAVALVHNGPLQATLRVRTTMLVPDRFCFDRMVRSEQLVNLVVDTLVTLRRGSDRVEVQSTIHNTPRDHRLRVLFPTAARAATYSSDSAFDVIERPIALRADNHLYRELEVETRPQQTWTSVHDGARGLAVVSTGIMESTVRDLPDRPIALTLIRGTGRTVMTDGEPDGQVPGDWTFRYWILPLGDAPDVALLCRLGQQLATGVQSSQLVAADLANHPSASALPSVGSLLSVSDNAVVSSIRQVAGRVEVRLFNPSDAGATATIVLGNLGSCISRVQRVDMESNPVGPLAQVRGQIVDVALAPKQIATLSLW